MSALTVSSFIFQWSLILIVKHQMLAALMEKTPHGFHGTATSGGTSSSVKSTTTTSKTTSTFVASAAKFLTMIMLSISF